MRLTNPLPGALDEPRGVHMAGMRLPRLAAAVAMAATGLTAITVTGSTPVAAANDTVTLRFGIEAVRALDTLDTGGSADFYPEITMAGGAQQGGPGLEITDQNEIHPDWTFTQEVPLTAATSTVPIHLELYDADGAFNGPRDHVDITDSADRDLDLTVNLTDCALKDPTANPVTGDVTGSCNVGLVSSGTASDKASIRFRVEVDAPDSDGDGLLDAWEINGLDADGNGSIDVNLPAMGAKPDHKDLFLELDTTAASTLTRADILAVKKAFAAAPIDAGTKASEITDGKDAKPNPDGQPGINLHIDTGPVVDTRAREGQPLATCNDGIDNRGDGQTDAADPDCSGNGRFLDASTEDPQAPNCTDGVDNDSDGLADGSDPDCLLGDNLGGGGRVAAPSPPACNLDPQYYAAKAMNFSPLRARVFRYGLSLALDPTCPTSGGWGEIGGNDFMEFNFDGGTVMHEFGHTLNLDHGGFEGANCKPNYVSGMNYDNQFAIRRVGGGSIIDYSPPRLALDGSTRGQVTPRIDETSLNENTILDPSDTLNRFVYVDSTGAKRNADLNGHPNYNNDTDPPFDSGFGGNVDTSDSATGQPSACANNAQTAALDSQNDWQRISLPFRQFGEFANAPRHPVTVPEPNSVQLRQLEDAINRTDLSVTKTGPTGNVAAGTNATYSVTITNKGPNPAPGVLIDDTLPTGTTYVSNDSGCTTVSASTLRCAFGELAVGASRTFSVTVAVARDLVYQNGAPLDIVNAATGSAARGSDPVPSDNTGRATTHVVAVADLGVTNALQSPPTELIIGQPKTVTVRSAATNAGPSAPMDAALSVGASAQAGSTATPTTQSSTLFGLDLGPARTTDLSFQVSCQAPGEHTITFTSSVSPSKSADSDPVASNNSAVATLTVDCVVPVAVNIKPGGDPNSINRNSGADIPLAVLTTRAGEYGLPLDFDATMILPLTARFGPIDVVNAGRGATEVHSRNHLERSYELDEKTRDADLDDVLHFSPPAAELLATSTQGCVKGKFTGPAGQIWTFLGCGPVRIVK